MGAMLLPAGRTAEARHLQFDEELQCWTVRCNKCAEDLPCTEEFFGRDGRGPASWCRACRAESARSWYRRRGRAMRMEARKAG